MTRIDLRFSHLPAIAACYGFKCCTTRTEKQGEPDDEFCIGGFRFRVLDVVRLPLHRVVSELYRLEGFECPGDCAATLNEYDPELDPISLVWVHYFARVP